MNLKKEVSFLNILRLDELKMKLCMAISGIDLNKKIGKKNNQIIIEYNN